MKKCLSSFAAGLFLLFSLAANAATISANDGAGYQGGAAVTLDVMLNNPVDSGPVDFTFGGNFRISFTNSQLSLISIVIPDLFIPLSPNLESQVVLSLACAGSGCAADYDGPVFSLNFSITAPYSTTPSDNLIPVTIEWSDAVDMDFDVVLDTISPVIEVLNRNDGTIPEPGALVLVALGLLIMTGVGRRSRLFR